MVNSPWTLSLRGKLAEGSEDSTGRSEGFLESVGGDSHSLKVRVKRGWH